jgi:ABC-type uncharacterized transport system auxiliary subunit
MKTSRFLWILPPLAALLLGACGSLLTSDQPPRQVYLLQPSPAAGSDAAGPAVQISVTAVPGLDTDRILALDPDARLSPYANARWADHLPEVLGSVLQRSLEPAAAAGADSRAANSAARPAIVDLELRAFYGIRGTTGTTSSVRAELAGTLGCAGHTLDLRLSAASRVAEERLAAVVAAHQRALDEMTDDLRQRLHAACAEPGP